MPDFLCIFKNNAVCHSVDKGQGVLIHHSYVKGCQHASYMLSNRWTHVIDVKAMQVYTLQHDLNAYSPVTAALLANAKQSLGAKHNTLRNAKVTKRPVALMFCSSTRPGMHM